MKNEFPVYVNTGYGIMIVQNKAEADFAWHELCRYYIEMTDRLRKEQRKAVRHE